MRENSKMEREVRERWGRTVPPRGKELGEEEAREVLAIVQERIRRLEQRRRLLAQELEDVRIWLGNERKREKELLILTTPITLVNSTRKQGPSEEDILEAILELRGGGYDKE